MTEDFPFVTSGKEVKLTHNNKETAGLMVKTLRKQGAQIVVALAQIGYPEDIEIAKSVHGIDIFLAPILPQRHNRNSYCGIKDWKKGNITCKGPLKYKRVAAKLAKKKNRL